MSKYSETKDTVLYNGTEVHYSWITNTKNGKEYITFEYRGKSPSDTRFSRDGDYEPETWVKVKCAEIDALLDIKLPSRS